MCVIVGRFGVSTPRSFVVGNVPEQQESGDHHTPETASPLPLDVVMNGRTDGGAVDYYRFSAQQGQKLVVECVAQEIESNLNAVITIWDCRAVSSWRGASICWIRSWNLSPPPQVSTCWESTTMSLVAAAAYAYRLRIHSGPYLIAVSPAAASPGTNTTFTVYGRHLPAGEQSTTCTWTASRWSVRKCRCSFRRSGDAPPAVVDPVTATPDGFVFRWPTPDGTSNGLLVAYARTPGHCRSGSQRHAGYRASDHAFPAITVVDSIRVVIRTGSSSRPPRDKPTRCASISHRLGHPTDPELFVQKVVRKDDGKIDVSQVSTEDDFQSDGERYRQALRPRTGALASRSGRAIHGRSGRRLSCRPA